MFENIRLSFQGVWSHKMRSFLTMLGIIIGIAAIIAIVSIIQGSNEQIKKNLIGSGTNTVNVRLTEEGDYEHDMEGGIPKGLQVFDQSMRDRLAAINDVEDVSLYVRRTNVDFVYNNGTSLQGGNLIGADIHYLNAGGYVITAGRGFLESDYQKFRKVAILDETAAKSLFGKDNPIGATIDIKGEPFTVIAKMKESSQFEPVINSVEDYYAYSPDENETSGMVLIPDTCWPMVCQYDEPQNVILRAASTDAMGSVGKEAAQILNDQINTEGSGALKYRVKDLSKNASETDQLSNTTNRMMIWIACISLLVGGIGVMNIMLVSVTERTREIGLKKAIGARKNRIMIQFLTEAAVLTSTGGIMGTIAGIILAEVISKVMNIPVAISIPAIIIAIAFSTLIGLVFGFLPAVQAANLDPIVALRHE